MSDDLLAGPDDYLDLNPRSMREVVSRLQILEALIRRALVETREENSEEIEPDRFDILAMLIDSRIDVSLTLNERDLLESPIGSLGEENMAELLWSVEAMLALYAAIGAAEIPAPPQTAVPAEMAERTALFDKNGRQTLERLEMLPDERLEQLRETIELWHWKALTEEDVRSSRAPEREALIREIQEVAEEASDAGIIALSSSGDFASGSTSVSSWSDETLAQFTVACETRLHAINWICGFGDDWDSVPLVV